MMDWLKYFDALNVWKQSGVYLAVLVFGAIVLNILVHLILKYLNRVNARRGSVWLLRILNALALPLQVYIWAALFCVFTYVLGDLFLPGLHHSWFNPVLSLASLAIFVWFLFRLVASTELYYLQHLSGVRSHSEQRSAIKALSHLSQLGVILFGVLILLGILNVPLAGLLTFGGVGSIAVAYASKGLLANYFAGISIYISRNFAVGDSIRSPDRDIEGVVEGIGWRATMIRRADKQLMVVPNEVFGALLLINVSRTTHCRIHFKVHVRYQDLPKLPDILSKLNILLQQDVKINHEEPSRVYLDECAQGVFTLVVDAFACGNDYLACAQVKERLMLKVADIVKTSGAELVPSAQVVLQK
jgi:MscS family membrane protein